MSDTQTIETPVDEVPAPSPEADAPAPKRRKRKKGGSVTKRSNRYRLFDDGDGDYRIFEIAPADLGLPKGALLPIPEIGGFNSTAHAKKFATNSGDMLNGKQILILKGLEICSLTVQTVTKVLPKWKPRKAVSGPAAEEQGGE